MKDKNFIPSRTWLMRALFSSGLALSVMGMSACEGGLQGPPGQTGPEGPAGPQGSMGNMGTQGTPGPAGVVLFRRVGFLLVNLAATGTTDLATLTFTTPATVAAGSVAVITGRGHCAMSPETGGGRSLIDIGTDVSATGPDRTFIDVVGAVTFNQNRGFFIQPTLAVTPGTQQTVKLQATRSMGTSAGDTCTGSLGVLITQPLPP